MRLAITATAALALAVAGPAVAQERGIEAAARDDGRSKVALVIGNGGYETAPLRNPPNDARDMAGALRDLGFEVMHRQDADLEGMKRAAREFGDRIRRADVALFYYAGHGVQTSGVNYLVPVGAVINSEPEVEYESVEVGFVIAQMEAAGTPLNIVILDACRNNPFARSWRSASRGLTQVTAPTGTLIAYATAPGSVASDGDGENGLYTQELLRYMRTPGLSVEDVFKQVRISLNQQTGGDQTPWESSSLVGDFFFAGAPIEPADDDPAPAEPTDRPPAERPEQAADADPRVSGPPAPPTAGDAALANRACLEPLIAADLTLFDRRFPMDHRPDNRKVLRQWLRTANAPQVRQGADRPGIDIVSNDGRTAVAGAYARLSWRSGFGVNRSTEIVIEAGLAFTGGAWALQSCEVAGSVEDLQ